MSHDDTIDSASDGSGLIRHLTLDQLRTYNFGHNFVEGQGTQPEEVIGHRPYRGTGKRLQIVTVAEVLGLLSSRPDISVSFDDKSNWPGHRDRQHQLSRLVGRQPGVIYGSFRDANVVSVRHHDPSMATAPGPIETALAIAGEHLGLPVSLTSADVFMVPENFGPVVVINRFFVEAMHKRGLPVFAWTIDEPEKVDELRELGVDGVVTNRPALMRAHLETQGVALTASVNLPPPVERSLGH